MLMSGIGCMTDRASWELGKHLAHSTSTQNASVPTFGYWLSTDNFVCMTHSYMHMSSWPPCVCADRARAAHRHEHSMGHLGPLREEEPAEGEQ